MIPTDSDMFTAAIAHNGGVLQILVSLLCICAAIVFRFTKVKMPHKQMILPWHQKRLRELMHQRSWREVLECVKRNPRLLENMENDNTGTSVLHFACLYLAPTDVIEKLLEMKPELAGMKNEAGELPLHWAVRVRANQQTLSLLLKVNPSAAFAEDVVGITPFRLLRLGCMIRDEDGDFDCISKRDKVKAWGELMILINAVYVYEITRKNGKNHRQETDEIIDLKAQKELHVATQISGFLPKEIYHLFVKFFSFQLSERDEYGSLPLHIAAESSSLSIISLLFQKYPAAAKVADSRGRYPLTLVIQRGLCWDNVIQRLFETFPEAAFKADRCSRLYPFMLASAIHNSKDTLGATDDSEKSREDQEQEERNRVDCSYRMLLRYPSAICDP
mmetsp:Transcript_14906/g.23129  ORF Transcript_14906/g.23129 Transcript_14906/m.23129 type:complete len:389 (+) Transcript_14906:1398-2564(+)